MIETTNNLIFWVGYAVVLGLGVLLFVFSIYIAIQGLKQIPQFWVKMFNMMLDRHWKKTTPEQFEKWMSKVVQRYKDAQKNISVEEREYIDKIHKKYYRK